MLEKCAYIVYFWLLAPLVFALVVVVIYAMLYCCV